MFSAYEGHSIASGFTGSDGDNQESTSEAVNAWAGIAQWGMVTNRPQLVDAAVSRYALEADSARTYWLGESGRLWPAAYAHDTVGIVWGGKVDFATFFDGRPESVIGIQLLPFTFASLYRTDAAAAAQRSATVAKPAAGAPGMAGPLPHGRRARRPGGGARQVHPEPVHRGRQLARVHPVLAAGVEQSRPAPRRHLRRLPYGFAFGNDGALHLAAINPTGSPITVTWRTKQGRVVGSVQLAAG